MQRGPLTRRAASRSRDPHSSRQLLLAAAAAAAALLAPLRASAVGVVDQSFECNITFAQIQFFAPTAQSFTPNGQTITAVEVHLLRFNSPGPDTITMNLRSGGPAGPIVATGSQLLTPPPDEQWVRYDLASPLVVVPGGTYVIELLATNPSWGWALAYNNQCPDYPGGMAFGQRFADVNIDANDWSFRTYGLCGDGQLAPGYGEQCDDGTANGLPGSCCTKSCTFASAGTVCRASAGPCDVVDTCNGSDELCPDVLVAAGQECRSSAGECDLADACDGVSAGCNDARKAIGTACTDDGTTCTADVCDGGVACTHPVGNAGVVCRAAADACDIAETCTGASATCPADQVKPDNDGDGECDAIDPCTHTGARDFVAKPTSKLKLTRIQDGLPLNDGLSAGGAFSLPATSPFNALEPDVTGARVVVEAAGGAHRVDVTLPPGAYSKVAKQGWKLAPNGRKWTFTGASGAGLNGVKKLVITDRSTAAAPRLVGVTVQGAKGTYPVVAADVAPNVVVTLGDATAAAAGVCGESTFVAADCKLNGSQTTLTCRR